MELIALFLALSSHELAHWIAARLCGIRVRGIFPGVGGLRLQLCTIPSYKQEGLICAAGPAINLLTAMVLLPFAGQNAFCAALTRYALCMGTCNLLPVAELDGGRMLFCATASRWGLRAADAVKAVSSTACLLALWLLSVYLVLRTASAFTPMLFSLLLFVHIFVNNTKTESRKNRRK